MGSLLTLFILKASSMKTFKQFISESTVPSTLTTNVDGKDVKLNVTLYKRGTPKTVNDILSIDYKGEELFASSEKYNHMKTGADTYLFKSRAGGFRLFSTIDLKKMYFE